MMSRTAGLLYCMNILVLLMCTQFQCTDKLTSFYDYMSPDSDVNTCIAKHRFGDQQALSLQDYFETSLMLQYNKH